MPELPEVETVRRGLEATIVGCIITDVILHRANLRYPFPEHLPELLQGQRIEAVGRRAKYLLMDSGAHRFIGHLGMSGTYIVRPSDAIPRQPHDHMVWQLEGGMEVVYHDPRRFAPTGDSTR
jgi:formamidopyrimidine-DNA glycosylase